VTIFPGLSRGETLAVAALSRLGRAHARSPRSARDAEVRAAVEGGEVARALRLADKLGRAGAHAAPGRQKLLDVAARSRLHPTSLLMDERRAA